MKKKLLAYLLFLFPLVAFAGHAHAETIKVVFDTAYAPFEFKDSDQTYKGIDVEILDKVAEINGWDLDKCCSQCCPSWSSGCHYGRNDQNN